MGTGVHNVIQFGKTGIVHWTVAEGDHDDANFAAFVQHLRSTFAESARAGDVSLTINFNGKIPNSPRRKQLAEVGAYLRTRQIRIPHAFVTNSRAGMGIMTAHRWVVKSDFPERAFTHPLKGLAWLATHEPSLQPEAFLSRLAAESIAYQRLAWANEAQAIRP